MIIFIFERYIPEFTLYKSDLELVKDIEYYIKSFPIMQSYSQSILRTIEYRLQSKEERFLCSDSSCKQDIFSSIIFVLHTGGIVLYVNKHKKKEHISNILKIFDMPNEENYYSSSKTFIGVNIHKKHVPAYLSSLNMFIRQNNINIYLKSEFIPQNINIEFTIKNEKIINGIDIIELGVNHISRISRDYNMSLFVYQEHCKLEKNHLEKSILNSDITLDR